MLAVNTKNRRLEWGVLCLFVVLLLGTMYVHEPWFDEAQAWLIARDAPFKDILWLLPHYEGHPPFFHLLLSIPAKLGIGWKWGLRGIGVLFSIASAYLIIFKAPFPRCIRLVLPFTYFLFYQYGVIIRPYNIIVFIMCLLAIYFPQKDKRPGLFVSLLTALCACHLFGIAIAGGITVAWLWDMKAGRPWKEYLLSLRTDKRFYWMLGLLGWVLLLIGLMYPRLDTFAINLPRQAPWWQNLLYVTVILPADLFFTNVYDKIRPLSDCILGWSNLLSGVVGGCLVLGLICVSLPRKYSKYLFVPYLFLIPLLLYYSSRHHIGLVFLVLLWGFWIAWATKSPLPPWSARFKKWFLILAISMLWCSVGWSLYDAYLDYRFTTFEEKFIQFLHRHQLEDKRIFAMWLLERPGGWGVSSKLTQEHEDTNSVSRGVNINLYARHNMIANLNGGSSISYLTHIALSPQENDRNFELWREGGIPDIVVEDIEWDRVFPQQPDLYKQYVPVYYIYLHDIWKYNGMFSLKTIIWAHKDLLDKHQLRIIKHVSDFDPDY